MLKLLIYFPFSAATCPNGWYMNGEFCYLVVDNAKNWHKASSFCSKKGAKLTSIQDEFENDFIQSKFLLSLGILSPLLFSIYIIIIIIIIS